MCGNPFGGNKQQVPAAPPPLPFIPGPAETAASEKANQGTRSAQETSAKQAKLAAKSSTLLTGPLGVTGAAKLQKKTLLGL